MNRWRASENDEQGDRQVDVARMEMVKRAGGRWKRDTRWKGSAWYGIVRGCIWYYRSLRRGLWGKLTPIFGKLNGKATTSGAMSKLSELANLNTRFALPEISVMYAGRVAIFVSGRVAIFRGKISALWKIWSKGYFIFSNSMIFDSFFSSKCEGKIRIYKNIQKSNNNQGEDKSAVIFTRKGERMRYKQCGINDIALGIKGKLVVFEIWNLWKSSWPTKRTEWCQHCGEFGSPTGDAINPKQRSGS